MLKIIITLLPLLCATPDMSAAEVPAYKVFKDKSVTASEGGLMSLFLSDGKV